MEKYKFQISGKIEDNKTVIKNVFKLFDTLWVAILFYIRDSQSKIKSTILEAIIYSEYFIKND
ncbi:MAG: hypothetical protein KC589_07495 [Nanoarchaeota archaeon]|nr:hypothetical protein [Nanoarchaeota archaeon]